eukprot:149229_1
MASFDLTQTADTNSINRSEAVSVQISANQFENVGNTYIFQISNHPTIEEQAQPHTSSNPSSGSTITRPQPNQMSDSSNRINSSVSYTRNRPQTRAHSGASIPTSDDFGRDSNGKKRLYEHDVNGDMSCSQRILQCLKDCNIIPSDGSTLCTAKNDVALCDGDSGVIEAMNKDQTMHKNMNICAGFAQQTSETNDENVFDLNAENELHSKPNEEIRSNKNRAYDASDKHDLKLKRFDSEDLYIMQPQSTLQYRANYNELSPILMDNKKDYDCIQHSDHNSGDNMSAYTMDGHVTHDIIPDISAQLPTSPDGMDNDTSTTKHSPTAGKVSPKYHGTQDSDAGSNTSDISSIDSDYAFNNHNNNKEDEKEGIKNRMNRMNRMHHLHPLPETMNRNSKTSDNDNDWSNDLNPYQCQFCPFSSQIKGNMLKHVRTHTNERPFKCTVCHRAFKQKNHLKNHSVTHASIKPHRCEKCGKRFTRKERLKTHQKSKHSLQK